MAKNSKPPKKVRIFDLLDSEGSFVSAPTALNTTDMYRRFIMQPVSWQLIRDAYYGQNGFANGEYLVKHCRETDADYVRRKQLAYYLNYTMPIVNSHVTPIFRSNPTRQWTDDQKTTDLYSRYLQDVDLSGSVMNDFMKQATLGAKLFGVVAIVTDNYPEIPQTMDQVLAQRVFPYSFIIEPDKFWDFEFDKHGRVIKFAYMERKDGVVVDQLTYNEDQWLYIYNVKVWTKDQWALYDMNGGKLAGGVHDLGRIPVSFLSSRKRNAFDLCPPSDFGAIVTTNTSIYNKCSWLDEIFANQTFNTLVLPSEEIKSVQTGTHNAICFNGAESRHAPQYIAPASAPANILIEHIGILVEEIYRMAQRSHAIGVQSAKSGVAIAFDFEESNKSLDECTNECEYTEYDIADIFSRWTKQDIVDLLIMYARDFNISDNSQDLIDAMNALTMPFGVTFRQEVFRNVKTSYMPKISDETANKISEEIAQIAEDERQAGIIVQTQTTGGRIGSISDNNATKTSNAPNQHAEPLEPLKQNTPTKQRTDRRQQFEKVGSGKKDRRSANPWRQ